MNRLPSKEFTRNMKSYFLCKKKKKKKIKKYL